MTDAYRPEDELDRAIARVQRQQTQRTRQAYIDPLAPNPEEAAKTRRLSELSGLPEPVIQANPGMGEASAAALLADQHLESSPRLRDWVSDPRNAAVARDDIENLSIFEQVARSYMRQGDRYRALGPANADQIAAASFPADPIGVSAYALGRTFDTITGNDPLGGEQQRQGVLDVEYGKLAYRAQQAARGNDTLTPEEVARLDELATREGQENWGPFLIGPTRRLIPQLVNSFGQAAREAPRGFEEAARDVRGDPLFNFGLEMGPLGPSVRVSPADNARARRVLSGQTDAGGVLTELAGEGASVPFGALGAFGRGAGGYLSAGYEMETGVAFDAMVRQGIAPEIAAERAEQYGAVATAIEFASDALGLRISDATRFATRAVLAERALAQRPAVRAGEAIIGTGLEQGVEEGLQEYAQIIHQDLAAQDQANGQDGSSRVRWSEVLTPEHIEQILQAAYIGFQGGVGMGAIPGGANYFLDIRAVSEAERSARVFEQYTRAAQASRLNERGLASTMESAIGAMDESNVYIEAERFFEHFQSAGVSPYAVAEELGIGEQRLAEALSSHGQVEIPTARFAARVLRIPAHAGLAQHARIAPDASTPAEAQMDAQRIQADVERMAGEMLAVAEADAELGQTIETRMRELFSAAQKEGGPRAEVAARYARIAAALPRALVARARATNPEYAAKLEQQFRALFGENLDVAGPGRELGDTQGAEVFQRGTGPDAGPTRNDTYSPPEGVRMSERMRKIVEMAINGASNDWIAEEMDVTANNVRVTLNQAAKRLGGDQPWERAGTGGSERGVVARTGEQTATSEQLARVRAQMRAAGTPEREINGAIAERFGMRRTNVSKRLWDYDQAQKKAEREAVREPEPETATQLRRQWVETQTVRQTIPGGEPGDFHFGFVLSSGKQMYVGIADDGNGAAQIDWSFLERLKNVDEDNPTALYRDGDETLSLSEWRELRIAIRAIFEWDMATHERPAYTFTPQRESNRRTNMNMIAEMGDGLGYHLREEQGSVYLFHPDAGIANNGRIKPQDGWAPNFEEPQTYGSQEEADDAQNAFYASVEEADVSADGPNLSEVARATRRERQEAEKSRAEAERVAGRNEPGSGELKQGGDAAAIQRHYEFLEAILDERRTLSTPGLRRTPPKQIPEVGTREYAETVIDAREARDRGERLTEVQRALIRWEENNQIPEGLFQGEKGATRAYQQGEFPEGVRPYGMAAFSPGEFGEAMIRLTQSYDLSTFLHETGHLFHNILESIGTDPNAPEELRGMWQTTLDWWGVDQATWSGMQRPERTQYYERWAQTFERYLMEGQAPSLSLREVFAVAKQWMLDVYRSLQRFMGVNPAANLTPEIRDVFDRLLATDQEIAEARAAMGSDFALSREAFKTDEEFQQYQSAIAEAKEAQEAELRARAMDAYARKSKRWWRGERERVRDAATRAVDSDPARRVEQWLGRQDWRVLPETLSDEGEISYVAPEGALEEMPEGLPSMQLSAEAIAQDWPNANLPVSLRPRTDTEAVLAEAMALKAQTKGRGAFRAQRLSRFIKDNGGLSLATLSEEQRAQFDGVARKRPGLINNASGKTPEEMMRLATEAGYFGEGAARELKQGPQSPDAGHAGAGTWYRGTVADKPLEPGLGGAVWLSDNADVANRYSSDAYLRTRQRGQVYDFPQAQPRNPLVVDMHGEPIMALYGRLRRDLQIEGDYAEVLRGVRERGYDAIIIRNVRDQYTPGARGTQTQMAVLDPAILGQPHVNGRPWQSPDGGAGRAVSVSELRSRFDPFGPENPWEVPQITEAEVRRAMESGATETRRFDDQGPDWTRQDHINRIATLAREGWDQPIDLTSRQGVADGVHRLAAAIIRGDETIATRAAADGAFGWGDVRGAQSGLRVERDGSRWQVVDADGAVIERLPPGASFADAERARIARQSPNEGPSLPGFELFQGGDAPIFESAVLRVVEASKTTRAPGSQWWATISKAPGVKKEELQWIGLEDFLNAREGQITREEVLEFVRANGVRVEETVLGGETPDSAELQRRLLPLIEERDRLQSEIQALRLRRVRETPATAPVPLDIKAGIDERLARLAEIEPEIINLENSRRSPNNTKWSQYTLPGGSNYRELLLRLPDGPTVYTVTTAGGGGRNPGPRDFATRAEAEAEMARRAEWPDAFSNIMEHAPALFRSSHFDAANILAHVRFNERTDSSGRRTLFIEEVQSDWHQAGRERGYNTPMETAPVDTGNPDNPFNGAPIITRQAGVPDAPFKNNAWASLALKRMIRWGAENGFDQIAWTRGQHQIERFNLANHVRTISYRKTGDLYEVAWEGLNGEAGIVSHGARPDQLQEMVGADVARQILAGEGKPRPRSGGTIDITDLDTKVGGEGMRAFYDRIMVNIANDLGKKYGARVGETQIPLPSNTAETSAYKPNDYRVEERDGGWIVTQDRSRAPGTPVFATKAEADARRARIVAQFNPIPETVHSLPITPEMREAVSTRGFELFAGADKLPTVEEFLSTLISDLRNERQVYSARDAGALASAQALADAQQWFDSHDIDLSKGKEEIRAQIVAAIENDRASDNQWHPDDVAAWFSFSSGDELVQALANLKPRNVAIEEQIDSMLEAEHGDAGTRSKIEETARLAAHAEVQARRIEIELAAIQKATGGRATPVGRAAKAYAERQIQAMTVKQIRNYETFLAGERRAARAAMEATQKKDYAEAARHKQRQLISFHLYRFARDASEEMDRAQRYFQKFDRDTVRAKIHPPLMDQIDQALEGIDMRAKPRISERKRQGFLAWFNEMQAEGLEHMVMVDPEFMEDVRQRPFASLTLEDARSMRDAVRNLEHIGRRWREVLAARDQRLLDEEVALMAANMAEVKPFELANAADHSPGLIESIDIGRQKFHAILSRVEFVAFAMDGHRYGGPVQKGLIQPMRDARGREELRQEGAQEAIEQLFSVYTAKERADMWTLRRYYPQVPNRDGSRMGRNFTKQEILALALNTGNEYSWNALIEGERRTSGATESQIRTLLDAAMDRRDWEFVQSVWDYVDTFWPEIEALYLKTTGVAPPKVQATPFQNRHGDWRGGYYHLQYDFGRDQRAREEFEFGRVQEAFGGFRLRTQTPNGFARARQGSGGRPVLLDLSVLTEHVNGVIHDLEFRVPVLNAWRLIKHGEFRDAFVRAAGQAQYDQLKPWLQYIATERMPPENIVTGSLKLLRQNTPIVLMGYSVSTVAQQPAGILGTMHRLGPARVAAKLAETVARPWTWLEMGRFINSRSVMMRNRTRISQREIREMVAELNSEHHVQSVSLLVNGNARQKIAALGHIKRVMGRYALWPLAFVDKIVSSVPWTLAYEDAIAGRVPNVNPQSEKEAVDYADHIIATTFGSGRPEDLPPIMRANELGKLITPAFSYFSTQYNQLYNEQLPGMMRGKISVVEFMTFVALALVAQQLISTWAAGRWDDDDEDDETRTKRLAAEVAIAPLAGVPIVRDIARGVAQQAATGRKPRGDLVPAFGAITSTTQAVGGTIEAIGQGEEIDRTTMRAIVMSGGYWLGLPSNAFWRLAEGSTDIATGEDDLSDPAQTASELLLRDAN